MYVLEVGHSRSIPNSSDIGNVFFRFKLWTLDKLVKIKNLLILDKVKRNVKSRAITLSKYR